MIRGSIKAYKTNIMCETIEELNSNIKTRLDTSDKFVAGRFDSLEKALIMHAEMPPTALSPLINEIRTMVKNVDEKISRVEVQTTKTNGRVTRLEVWQGTINGMSAATKTILGSLTVFIVAAAIALFNMYVEFQSLNRTIKDEVRDQLDGYEITIKE